MRVDSGRRGPAEHAVHVPRASGGRASGGDTGTARWFDVVWRIEADVFCTIKSTFGVVRFPWFAFRHPERAKTLTPARSLFPQRALAHVSEVCLEWERALAAEHPFRRGRRCARLLHPRRGGHRGQHARTSRFARRGCYPRRLVVSDPCGHPHDSGDESDARHAHEPAHHPRFDRRARASSLGGLHLERQVEDGERPNPGSTSASTSSE